MCAFACYIGFKHIYTCIILTCSALHQSSACMASSWAPMLWTTAWRPLTACNLLGVATHSWPAEATRLLYQPTLAASAMGAKHAGQRQAKQQPEYACMTRVIAGGIVESSGLGINFDAIGYLQAA